MVIWPYVCHDTQQSRKGARRMAKKENGTGSKADQKENYEQVKMLQNLKDFVEGQGWYYVSSRRYI